MKIKLEADRTVEYALKLQGNDRGPWRTYGANRVNFEIDDKKGTVIRCADGVASVAISVPSGSPFNVMVERWKDGIVDTYDQILPDIVEETPDGESVQTFRTVYQIGNGYKLTVSPVASAELGKLEDNRGSPDDGDN